MSWKVRDAINFDPKFQEFRHKYHNELRDGCFKVRFSENFLKCPFCLDIRDYGYTDLFRHATQIVTESKTAGFKEKAKHMGLIDYLETDFYAKIKWSDSTVEQNANEELVVWPWMAVVANIPVEYENDSGKKLKDDWTEQGYNPVKVHLLSNLQFHSGLAVVEFGKTWEGFFHVMTFMKAFGANEQGRKDWFNKESCKDDKLYAWMATDEDYNIYGLVGDYLRKNGDLKTVADVQKEDESVILGLKTIIEEMDNRSEEMISKISELDVKLKTAMEQKELMIENFNSDMEMIQKKEKEQLKMITTEYDRSKWLLDDREKGLRAREAINEIEKRKLDDEMRQREKEKYQLVIDLQKKLDNEKTQSRKGKLYQKFIELQKQRDDEKRQSDMEKLHQKILELQKKLDEKQSLELTIKRMKGSLEVMKKRTGEHIEAKNKMKTVQNDLAKKEEKLKDLEALNKALMFKEQKSNDELVEARIELISGLSENTSSAHIGVKRMGELDERPFFSAAKRHRSGKEERRNAIKSLSLWENHLADLSWNPYKVITVEGKSEEILDEEDEKIAFLKEEYDKAVYDAVVTALNELNEYNPKGRCPVPELWNKMEERRATLKETVKVLLDEWKIYEHGKRC